MAAANPLDRLRARNLNLLVPLHVLLQTCSVSQAAEQLGTSASAVSKLLQALREELGDQLLVRSSNKMFLTDRARQLRPAVDRAIAQCRQLFDEDAFELAQVERVLVLGANDYIQSTLGVRLARLLRQHAPGVQLLMRPIAKGIPQLLAEGALDLCIGTENLEARGLRAQPLAREQLACITHRENAAAPRQLSLAQLCGCAHIDVSPSGLGLLPAIFERQALNAGQKRNVVMTASSYMALPDLLQGTNAVSMVPRRLLGLASFGERVREIGLRFPSPEFDLRLYWHNITHTDAFAVWLRDRLFELTPVQSAPPAAKRR
ncbi:hypothetical protein APR50_00575 [Variovorax paradoxus]|uniref:LysR family transcriptional regulator n=1 Tax=Variovorax paradoxus TaxID=34073 RepID=UPI0006E6808B|nr:hypothetical protein APR52_01030 [Variovorax paradoxus]KPV12504.1 hypothetical protein APR50_00575 [Variovorax paradoxus]KPV12732.1 hypothetical protein APR49_06450 [Variovorax paradoxus]KPV24896.1 hypothetical protein APR51_02970 [Variovorax paradoxus]KPV35930.1 hypothetical protein APR48_02130 [Variovorax paradoxus]